MRMAGRKITINWVGGALDGQREEYPAWVAEQIIAKEVPRQLPDDRLAIYRCDERLDADGTLSCRFVECTIDPAWRDRCLRFSNLLHGEN